MNEPYIYLSYANVEKYLNKMVEVNYQLGTTSLSVSSRCKHRLPALQFQEKMWHRQDNSLLHLSPNLSNFILTRS